MEAAVFDAPFALRLEERPTPLPTRGEVQVAVDAAGLCAGDLYIYLGKNPYVSYPRIGGHEIAGRVSALGPDTIGPALGTPVVVEPFIGCGHCFPCRVQKPNCCANLQIIGVHREGGFAESVTAPVDRLHVIPDGMTPFLASFVEPVAIGVQACRRGEVTAVDTVLILGAGPIGLAIAEVALARGAKVYITDIARDRLDIAAQLGAVPLEAGGGLPQEVMRLTGGEGMPVVIEATGNVKAMEQTAGLVAAGGRIVVVGLVGQGVPVSWPGLDLTRKEMTILGSRASTGCFPESLDLLARGAIRYPDIATGFRLSEAPSVFADLAQNTSALHKAVFLKELG
jgi:L-gulonate 5-dehydrogenase